MNCDNNDNDDLKRRAIYLPLNSGEIRGQNHLNKETYVQYM